MRDVRKVDAAEAIVLDYTSAVGPSVTHVRGTVVVSSLQALKELGCYERYVTLLPAEHRDAILYALVASWLPVEVALVHYEICDQLALGEPQQKHAGELLGKHVSDTFLGAIVRGSRSMGIESAWWAAKQADRVWDRLYMGGGCSVLQTGPKDLILELHGLPLVDTRYFRTTYNVALRVIAQLFCRVAFVNAVRSRTSHPQTIATAVSWT